MGIIVKKVLVKVNHSIKLVECYDSPLCQFYTIITTKILGIKPKLAFQMFFKAFNNLIGPNDLILIFLVIGAYPCMTEIDAPSSTST